MDKLKEGLKFWWWMFQNKDLAIYWNDTLRDQFPKRKLVPFAKHGASDDIACFDGADISGNPKVLIIHAFCEPGWELRGEASNLSEWLVKIEDEE